MNTNILNFYMNCFVRAFYVTAFLIFSGFLVSCSSDDGVTSCFPTSDVNVQYNMNLPLYNNLLNPNGYIEDNANGINGSRGLIIVNTGRGYKAYDRNAPHLCPGSNTTLTVEDDIKIVCPADGAEWILISGQPLNDATKGKTPRQYSVRENNNILFIEN